MPERCLSRCNEMLQQKRNYEYSINVQTVSPASKADKQININAKLEKKNHEDLTKIYDVLPEQLGNTLRKCKKPPEESGNSAPSTPVMVVISIPKGIRHRARNFQAESGRMQITIDQTIIIEKIKSEGLSAVEATRYRLARDSISSHFYLRRNSTFSVIK
ncbi:hypothetical protein PABG_12571 [Paracoccidioides brasiliensis Pb03]|nr:hypothetical protein PABG_12571 [Paracoccidioides brasiliensis Pb03]